MDGSTTRSAIAVRDARLRSVGMSNDSKARYLSPVQVGIEDCAGVYDNDRLPLLFHGIQRSAVSSHNLLFPLTALPRDFRYVGRVLNHFESEVVLNML